MAHPALTGIRVVEMTWVWSGPYCGEILAQLGAHVTKIESSSKLDMGRARSITHNGKPIPPEIGGGGFSVNNAGKRSVQLNLKSPAALEVARRLIKQSDIVIHNFAGGVLERLGLGYDELKKIKPDIILVAMTAYGETGPYKKFVGYGQMQAAIAGFTSLTGYKGWQPKNCGYVYADPTAGAHGAIVALAALRYRNKTGKGQYVDLSQWESTMQFVGEGMIGRQVAGREPGPNDGSRHPSMSPHGLFRCQDIVEEVKGITLDMWVSIVASNGDEWARLCGAIGWPELTKDPRFATLELRKRNEDELEKIIGEWTRPRKAEEVAALLQSAGVPAFRSNTYKDLFEDPNLLARKYFVELPHPYYGAKIYPGTPWRLNFESPVATAGPLLGQHTEATLKELGYSESEIEKLKTEGALT